MCRIRCGNFSDKNPVARRDVTLLISRYKKSAIFFPLSLLYRSPYNFVTTVICFMCDLPSAVYVCMYDRAHISITSSLSFCTEAHTHSHLFLFLFFLSPTYVIEGRVFFSKAAMIYRSLFVCAFSNFELSGNDLKTPRVLFSFDK